MKHNLLLAVITIISLGLFVPTAHATFQIPKVTICHTESNPDQTLEVSLSAVAAHLAHGDHLGACIEVLPSIIIIDELPTIEPSIEPSGDPEATPSAEPTSTPTSSGGTGQGDGKSDGRSDGLCSLPPCNNSGVIIPAGAPATGRAL